MATEVNVALITGGARRVGRAIVEDLAAHGWAVAIHCNRSRTEADELADRLQRASCKAAVVVGDLTDISSIGDIIAQTAQALAPPVLLVNNAATYVPDLIGALDLAGWRQQMAVNLEAPLFLSEAFAAALPEGVEGNIINLVDQVVWRPNPRYVSYQIAKSGLWTATRILAQALAPHVRVNAIAPGPTLPNDRQTEERFRLQQRSVLLRRGPELAEFGRTVRYFVENPSVTGQMIALDGGQHLAWETPDTAEFDE